MSNAPCVSNKLISTAGILKNKNNQMVPLRKKLTHVCVNCSADNCDLPDLFSIHHAV